MCLGSRKFLPFPCRRSRRGGTKNILGYRPEQLSMTVIKSDRVEKGGAGEEVGINVAHKGRSNGMHCKAA